MLSATSSNSDWIWTALGFLPLVIFAVLLFLIMKRTKGNVTRPEDKYDRLRKIAELRANGTLSEEEFVEEKRRILDGR